MGKAFLEPEAEIDANRVLVVDALNLAFRWKHRGDTDFLEEYISTVRSLARSYKCGTIIVTADGGSSTYRKELSPIYKQNRKDKQAEQTEEERDAFLLFFEEYQRTLDALRDTDMIVLQYDGVEADDIAGFLATHRSYFDYDFVWLVSSDKDWDQLVEDGVSRFSYVTRKEITVDNWDEHYPFPREFFMDVKVLEGDKGDNVLGIDGIGPKRAWGLIQKYGSAIDLYESLPLAGSAKYIQNLNANGDRIPLNYELMDLREFQTEAIGNDNLQHIIEQCKN